jgi:hypothetical protein
MIEFHKCWVDQCDAARGIKEEFGCEKALGYLIGEKLMAFVEASDRRPEFAQELPSFLREIRNIFNPGEIRRYLAGVRRVGALAHVCSDEEWETLRQCGAIDESPVRGAEEALLFERIREMLLVDST